ncbi:RNA-directed DNA polymerase, eukaryota [Tanacetum coccineum]
MIFYGRFFEKLRFCSQRDYLICFGLIWFGDNDVEEGIQGCLKSSMGSVLVNGSPTTEFEFHKAFSLFYADDAVFVGEWKDSNLRNDFHCLRCFYLASGLRLNIHKSKLMGIGVDTGEVVRATKVFGCSTLTTPFTYLGVLLVGSRKRRSGVSSFFALNRALLFKWVWRFVSQESSLWSRFIKSIYGGSGFLDRTIPTLRQSIWLDILKEVANLKNKGIDLMSYCRKKVGNGADTIFWDEVWIGEQPLKIQFPRMYALELRKKMSIVDKMSYANIADTFRRLPMGGEESEQYINICNRLEMVQLSQMHDRWFWSLVGTGEFSVKSVRNLVDDTLLHLDSSLTRWIKMIPIKVNVFVWRVRMDKLPTRLNLSLRGVDIPSILCPVCDVVVESTSHILFSCPLAHDVLCKVMTWWDLDTPNILSYEEWLCWFSNLHIHKQAKIILEGVFYVMWWLIWRFRNKSLFGSSTPKKAIIFDDIVTLAYTWCSNRFIGVSWKQVRVSIVSGFKISDTGVQVAQRRLEDKQPKEKTNTDCLVKEQEKVHLGIKVGANITVTGVPEQDGAEGNVAGKKKVKKSMKANLGKLLKYNAWSTRWSPIRGSSTRKRC